MNGNEFVVLKERFIMKTIKRMFLVGVGVVIGSLGTYTLIHGPSKTTTDVSAVIDSVQSQINPESQLPVSAIVEPATEGL